ncbi:tlde1 domain-containing protein [Mesorhizobium sp. ANAO-SY3R2]|uniref:DUF2778 domain-containing protein n=1 Tax=Mesorhizobium sp. ANAO-SY3R2 TaxID=3166644 RepID=UPI00366AEACC
MGTALAGTAVWSVAGMVATTGSSLTVGSSQVKSRLQVYPANGPKARLSGVRIAAGKAPRLIKVAPQLFQTASLAAGPEKSTGNPVIAPAAAPDGKAARFDSIVKRASVTSEKLAQLFPRPSRPEVATAAASAPAQPPLALPAASPDRPQTLLAYAAPSPGGAAGAALSTLLAPSEEDLAATQAPDPETDTAAAVPVFEDTPSQAPVPQSRPRDAQAGTPTPEAEQADEREAPKQQTLAYARPDAPTESKPNNGLGRSLRNLFGGGAAKNSNGVAVYDISAAKVYMPDGSVLEAHSGIGKMADNPRYTHVKMNGPTPAHTYNLRMRESRFHGVEAIRMLPVDGKNKFGRDGFLTHSYLLRGGREESHGCVAFADYPRFLAAFKQGKVRQIVVVPSDGHATMTRLASNGRRT